MFVSGTGIKLLLVRNTSSAWWQQQQSQANEASFMNICAMDSDRHRSSSWELDSAVVSVCGCKVTVSGSVNGWSHLNA